MGDDDIEGFFLIDEVNCFLFSASFDSKLVLTESVLERDEGFEDEEERVGIFLRMPSFFVPVLLQYLFEVYLSYLFVS